MDIATKSQGTSPLLSRLECNIMRGLAIVVIVLNNFGHLVNGVHPDNEYNYYYSNVQGFIDSLLEFNSLLPLELLSFYSPFGVMLFIFLSGYGLTLKYEFGNGKNVSHKNFVVDHYKKLFSMQAKGLALFLLFFLLYQTHDIIFFWPFVKQLFMIGNLFPNPKITPGPYWFFGMIIEIYIIFRFVFYRRSSYLMIFIVMCSLGLMALLEPEGETLLYVRINSCMALLPFSLGVLVARHWRFEWTFFDSKVNCLICFLVSFIFLTLVKFNFYSWLLMPIFIVTTTLSFVKLLERVSCFSNVFDWLGGLSGVMFVVHPALRQILFNRANESGHPYAVIFSYFFLTIVLSMILKPVFSKQ